MNSITLVFAFSYCPLGQFIFRNNWLSRKPDIRSSIVASRDGVREHAKLLRDRDQFPQRLGFRLFHHLLTVRLDGTLRRSKFMRDLLVDLATDDLFENLTFTGRKGRDMSA